MNHRLFGMFLLAAFFSTAVPYAGGDGFIYSNGPFTTINVSGFDTQANAINDAAQVVGFYRGGAAGYTGFLYSGGVFKPLTFGALGINDGGDI